MKYTIKEKEYEALINMYFLGQLQQKHDVTIDEILGVTNIEHDKDGNIVKNEVIIKGLYNTNPSKYTYEYFYDCLRLTAELNDTPFDLKKIDIIEFLDANGGIMGDIAKGFMLNMTEALYGLFLPSDEGEDTKKK